ncbi:adenylate kinase [Euzebya tangerina]|uniref:adenylate kinase n=1 Tax=Euzebya tangerina TaxID=591198 RepID=UPI000E312555|nr:adenylate kinase [Euzebya tangerina]
MRLILLGPPGAGKGTQSEAISATFGIPHISTGDIFRANVAGETPLGKEAQGYMSRGELVPDELVNRMVADRLRQDDAETGFLLDGYPRTVGQAFTLAGMVAMLDASIDAVLHFKVDLEELESRIAKRQEEEGRDDDSAEVFERRMREYRDQTTDLIPHYAGIGLLVDIDAVGTIEEVRERVLAACREAADE